MKCKQIKNLLYLYSTGETTSSEKSDIEQHLKGCVDCSSSLNNMKKTLYLIDEYKANPGLGEEYFDSFTINAINKIRSLPSEHSPSRKALEGIFGVYFKPVVAFAVILTIIFTIKQIPINTEQGIIDNLEIVENMDLYQNMDMIENINEIEKL